MEWPPVKNPFPRLKEEIFPASPARGRGLMVLVPAMRLNVDQDARLSLRCGQAFRGASKILEAD